jgi:hypothetical protein
MEQLIAMAREIANRSRMAREALEEGFKEEDVDSMIGVVQDKLKTMKRGERPVMFKTEEEAIAASHNPDISRVANLARNIGDYIVGG